MKGNGMFCSNCGKPLDDGMSFCPYCGNKVTVPGAGTSYEQDMRSAGQSQFYDQVSQRSGQDEYAGMSPFDVPEKKGGKSGLIIALVIVMIVALAAAAFVLFGMRGGSDGSSGPLIGGGSSQMQTQNDGSGASGEAASSSDDFDTFESSLGSRTAAGISLVSTDVSEYPTVKMFYNITLGDEMFAFSSPEAVIRESVSGGEFISRKVKLIERLEGNEGLSIDLILDKSDSMYQDIAQVKSITNSFISSLDYSNGDKAELIAFDSAVMYMCMYTNDAALLQNGVNNMSTYGMTALYDALMEGIRNASYQTGARCVIAFTDGQDNESASTAYDVISLAQSLSVPVYIIGTSGADSSTLMNITSSTGGYYWNIDSISDMSQIFNTIYTNQKGMYCIEYESDSSIDRYTSRTVDFAIRDSKCGAVCRNLTFTPVKTLQQTSHSSRYEAVKGDVSWSAANTEAIRKGGHLATITSQSEMDKLTSAAAGSGLEFGWLGGYTSINGAETYGHWITGEPFSFTSWYPGEPSRNDKDGAEEMYLMLWKIQGSWSWNDQRNDPINETDVKAFRGKSGYIIEYEN